MNIHFLNGAHLDTVPYRHYTVAHARMLRRVKVFLYVINQLIACHVVLVVRNNNLNSACPLGHGHNLYAAHAQKRVYGVLIVAHVSHAHRAHKPFKVSPAEAFVVLLFTALKNYGCNAQIKRCAVCGQNLAKVAVALHSCRVTLGNIVAVLHLCYGVGKLTALHHIARIKPLVALDFNQGIDLSQSFKPQYGNTFVKPATRCAYAVGIFLKYCQLLVKLCNAHCGNALYKVHQCSLSCVHIMGKIA